MTEDWREVCALAGGVMSPGGSTPIRLITRRPWLAPSSSTRSPMGRPHGMLSLAGGLRAYRVPPEKPGRVGPFSAPAALGAHDRGGARPCSRCIPFWAKPLSVFGLLGVTVSHRMFACADHTTHPSPAPPDTGRCALTSRLRRRSCDRGYIVRGLDTGCYHPAFPRRVLLMGQQVRSWLAPCRTIPQATFTSHHSVTLGLAPGRPSRIPSALDVSSVT